MRQRKTKKESRIREKLIERKKTEKELLEMAPVFNKPFKSPDSVWCWKGRPDNSLDSSISSKVVRRRRKEHRKGVRKNRRKRKISRERREM